MKTARIRRSAIDAGYAVRRTVLKWLRWRTQGVKVAVFDRAGQVMLVKNGYGDPAAWVLPGGGVKFRETPEAAAAREIVEETGCRLNTLTPVATFVSTAEGKRDTIHLFRASTGDVPIPDGVEVVETGFFDPGDLPAATSPATRRRIGELSRGERPAAIW